jgi:hypothetical protein
LLGYQIQPADGGFNFRVAMMALFGPGLGLSVSAPTAWGVLPRVEKRQVNFSVQPPIVLFVRGVVPEDIDPAHPRSRIVAGLQPACPQTRRERIHMGKRLLQYYQFVGEKVGLNGKVKLARSTKISLTQAAREPDDVVNLELFRTAVQEIVNEVPPDY